MRVQKCHKNDSRIGKVSYNEGLREFKVFRFSERLRSKMITGGKNLHRGKILQGGEEGVKRTQ